ncbi:manganese efflux pump MntP family protein [Sphingomicrobium sp. XHP0235]|uniref:manganese efflux pump MntP n=1 Tax=Sphingomicrobium aquimarinum TaxID=3133971 RepID=UPI0031FE72B1
MVAVVLLALGLAMDAFAASIARGAGGISRRDGVLLALAFGLFQGLMPLIGLLLGDAFAGTIEAFDHWIAFFLLGFIGIQMIREGLDPAEAVEPSRRLTLGAIVTLAVATSIDAAVAGLTLRFFDPAIGTSLLLIGGVTFVLSIVGFTLGARLGMRIGKRAEMAGGTVLVLLGAKILAEHTGLLAA